MQIQKLFFLILLSLIVVPLSLAQPVDIYTTPTCPFCLQAKAFLDEYNIEFNEYNVHTQFASLKLQEEYDRLDVPMRSRGGVPFIVIGDWFVSGFNEQIKNDILVELNLTEQQEDRNSVAPSILLLAVTLGFVDGFNVCSIGALIFILGLVLTLGSRKKIFIVGITFIVAVVIIYWFLIFLWYQFFLVLSKFIPSLSLLVGLIALGAGIYAFKEFLRFRKEGPTCEFVKPGSLVWRLRSSIQETINKPKSLLALLGAVFLFAAVITIIEFPCSAALPATFTGVLAEQQVSLLHFIFYASIYTLFYLLVELIVFTIAVFSTKLWLASPKAVTWVTLLGAVVLVALGLYYIYPIIALLF